MYSIGIIGGGFVGQATALLHGASSDHMIHVKILDLDPNRCQPKGLTEAEFVATNFDFVFICVPTPMTLTGCCYTTIVESCIAKYKPIFSNAYLIVRSTVPIGFCEKHDVFFMPEFLTEANWQNDFRNNDIVIGYPSSLITTDCAEFQSKFDKMIEAAICLKCFDKTIDVRFTSTSVAEAVKYFRNCFLALKVGFCNEMYDLCKQLQVSYDNVAQLACLDKRIGASHSRVPGPDGQRGFGGTCFPKDLNSLFNQQLEHNVSSYLIAACLERNEHKDRPEKEWCELAQFKNRAIINTKENATSS